MVISEGDRKVLKKIMNIPNFYVWDFSMKNKDKFIRKYENLGILKRDGYFLRINKDRFLEELNANSDMADDKQMELSI